jgi:hypothetical protein
MIFSEKNRYSDVEVETSCVGFKCYGCKLNDDWDKSLYSDNLLDHLEDHKKAGHKVTKKTITAIKKYFKNY